MKLKRFLQFFGLVTVLLTLMPSLAVQYWWIVIFDFPHLQLTVLTLVSFLAFFIRFDIRSKFDYIFAVLLAGCFVFQLAKIYPYTPLAAYEVSPYEADNANRTVSIYAANVLQKNQKSELLINEIKKYNADVVVLTETNLRWSKIVNKSLNTSYEYSVQIPLENTYGMIVFSKFPMLDNEVKYMVDDSIPSIHSKLILPGQDTLQLYAIHPMPPLPEYHPKSTIRDAELMKFAKLSRASKYPVIATGDFNDVAWSRTTSLFQNISGLLDIRKGRGFYNTFHANYIIFRWPLDHIFISPEFKHIDLELGKKVNSDHIPIYIKLGIDENDAGKKEYQLPTKEEIEKANELIQKGMISVDQKNNDEK